MALSPWLFQLGGEVSKIWDLLQVEHPIEATEGGWLDETNTDDGDAMQFSIKVLAPKIEKLEQNRELRCNIQLLPQVGLQKVGVVRHVVEDFCRGEAKIPQLF